MAKIKKFSEYKRFIELNFLTEILDSVKELLPKDLKYIKIFNERVGFQQGSLQLTFYNENWKVINDQIDADFNNEEEYKYGDSCLSDYIHNTLAGMNHDTDLIDWRHSDEFFDKVHLDDIVYYEYPK